MSKWFQAFQSLLLLSLIVFPSIAVEGQRPRPRTRQATSSTTTGPNLQNRLDLRAQGITIRYPAGWASPPQQYENMQELVNLPSAQFDGSVSPSVRIQITTVRRTNHQEALRELRDIVTEVSSKPTFLTIGGWPALQRRHLEPRPQPGEVPRFADKMMMRITTAVAAADLLVRVEAFLPSEANQTLMAQVEAIGRSLGFANVGTPGPSLRELQEIRGTQPRPATQRPSNSHPPSRRAISSISEPRPISSPIIRKELAGAPAPATEWPFQDPPLTRVFTGGNGEFEIAVSPNARNIVIARQFVFRTSNNGGQTFTFSGGTPFGDGDPSLAWARSGNFYLAGVNLNCTATTDCTGIARSTNNGQTFPFLVNAISCSKTGIGTCFPDQEHITADAVNAAPGGGDQVYSVWRNFNSSGVNPAIICSQDSGANWTAAVVVENSADVPRVGIGRDGFVYAVYRQGGNIRLHKYSSCATGLVPQFGFPVTVSAVNDVPCPVSGLDRCNDGNILSSHTIAVDDTNPNHVYVAYAHNTAAGNENVLVRDSLDGGLTWLGGRVVTLNATATGRRFLPWLSANGGEAFVSWYDRRVATLAANDLTEYFGGRARLDTAGNLVAGPEFKISRVADPQCASGWPCAPRSPNDANTCSAQPQIAGRCCDNTQPNCPGTQTRCNFLAPVCPGIETCNTGGGCPKYGDYNGNAAAAGRFFTAFASATAPPEMAPPSAAIDVFMTTSLVGNVPEIQVPAGVAFGSTCVGTAGRQMLNVCNTGNASLSINFISSSNPRFAVTTPSGGFPVIIAPGSCFPFEVTFIPAGLGTQIAALTVASDDPSTPSVTVAATATGEAGSLGLSPNLRFLPTVIQSVGACSSSRPFVISNTGTCNLTITNVAIGGANASDYSLSGLPAFPITLQPGHAVGSGDLNVVFGPNALARERTADITVTFVSNPTSGATSTETRLMCGESVRTGARVLVTQGGVPMAQVHEIELKRLWGFLGLKKEIDEVKNVSLQTVTPTPGTACGGFQFHREWGGVTNPDQLPPGIYQLKVEAKIGGSEVRKKVYFSVDTCGFNGTIVVDF
jgi:hypothetical protein